MEINYEDLVFEREIKQAGSSHVYSGKYNNQDVAIKVYDRLDPRKAIHKFYGVSNICLIEHQNLLKVRKNCCDLLTYLQEPIGITRNPECIDILVSKLIKDDNGKISNELKDSKELVNRDFIDKLNFVLYSLAEQRIFHMHLEDQRNILVNLNSKANPIIIDFQSINDIYYPWLKMTKYFGESAEKRYFRRVNRLIKSLEESLD